MWIAIWLILDFMGYHPEPPHSEIPAVVEEYFGEEASTALGVFWCESLHRPTAVSHTDDHGVAQLSDWYWGAEAFGERWNRVYEVRPNIAMAYEIWSWGERKYSNGWVLWTCGRNI